MRIKAKIKILKLVEVKLYNKIILLFGKKILVLVTILF